LTKRGGGSRSRRRGGGGGGGLYVDGEEVDTEIDQAY